MKLGGVHFLIIISSSSYIHPPSVGGSLSLCYFHTVQLYKSLVDTCRHMAGV